jgi:hypothetical protein
MSAHRRLIRVLGSTLILSLLPSVQGHSQPPTAPTEQPPPMAALKTMTPHLPQKERDDWRRTMSQKPVPKIGCFEAAHPSTEWKEVPCVQPPPYPYPPSTHLSPRIIGGAAQPGFSAEKTGLTIAQGMFEEAVVSDESGQVRGHPPLIANAFSLQLNTNLIPASQLPAGLCQGA